MNHCHHWSTIYASEQGGRTIEMSPCPTAEVRGSTFTRANLRRANPTRALQPVLWRGWTSRWTKRRSSCVRDPSWSLRMHTFVVGRVARWVWNCAGMTCWQQFEGWILIWIQVWWFARMNSMVVCQTLGRHTGAQWIMSKKPGDGRASTCRWCFPVARWYWAINFTRTICMSHLTKTNRNP